MRKQGLYAQHIHLHIIPLISPSVSYKSSVSVSKVLIVSSTSCKSFINKLCLHKNFKAQKNGQISCAHKPYFLMLGHIWS